METRSSTSLSSINSVPVDTTFDGLFSLLDRLKSDTSTLRDSMKRYSKRYIEVDLSEQLFEPRPSAKEWFKQKELPIPCDLESFFKVLFRQLAKERRICPRTRTVILNAEEAKLFALQPFFAYRWMDLLRQLPAVFH